MLKEKISRVSEILREKVEVRRAGQLIKASDWSYMVGFKDEDTEMGDILEIRGFKGEPNLMKCDLLKGNISEYSYIRVTGFSEKTVLGVVDVRRRVVSSS
jgi:hypothetical protein